MGAGAYPAVGLLTIMVLVGLTPASPLAATIPAAAVSCCVDRLVPIGVAGAIATHPRGLHARQ